jgi:hypothetical protein
MFIPCIHFLTSGVTARPTLHNIYPTAVQILRKSLSEQVPRDLFTGLLPTGPKRGTTMNRKLPVIALLVGALAVTGQASAHGRGGWEGPAVFGAIVGSAIVGSALINRDRPVYVQQPVYVQPQPVYVQQPPPVYYEPQPVYIERPVYYRPAPVYYGPPRGYYYGPPHGHYGRW